MSKIKMMNMTLEEYIKKRNFSKTPEPKAEVVKRFERIFVVQEHHASHLHWDFRIADEGVLKSWAIPKEPKNEIGIKRLAIQTEDHPLEYANFEGEIPKGCYGAGVVKIWDKGKYELLEKNENSYIIRLHGKKLRGKFILRKFPKGGKNSWLFFKAKE